MELPVRARREAENGLHRRRCGLIVVEPCFSSGPAATGSRHAHHRNRSRHRRGPRLARPPRPPARPVIARCRRGAAPPRRPPGFAGLARVVIGQQVSVASARRSGPASRRPSRTAGAETFAAADDATLPRRRPVRRQDRDAPGRRGRRRRRPRPRRPRDAPRRGGPCPPHRASAASARGRPTSISSSASAMPTSFRPATSRSATPSPTPSATMRPCRSRELARDGREMVAVAGGRGAAVLVLLSRPPQRRGDAALIRR